MNNVLELRGKRFVQASRTGNFSGHSMNGKEIVTSYKINRLIKKRLLRRQSFFILKVRFMLTIITIF